MPPGTDLGGADGSTTALAGSGDPPIEQRIENVMGAWRHAILNKDADTVVSVDRTFAAEREAFMTPLITSAETDSEERVRAFSTRVLGKFQAARCAEVFGRLLKDKSEHVRGNAAWGLGELANKPDGRESARKALPTLRRIEKQDPSAEARDAAATAVKKLK
ncbi:MAG TPA: HEAT repeat domain-containing protein [Polyangia bacterium]|nr:HEAT repeat domain-containing protein [Polyangia bacterium]